MLRCLGLACVMAACSDAAAKLPVSEANPNARPATQIEPGFYEYTTPAESLLVHEWIEGAEGTLLFYRGRGVNTDERGRGYLPDQAASRVLRVGSDMAVEDVIGGPTEAAGGVGLPLSAAPTGPGALFLVDVEHPDGLMYFDETGAFVGAAAPPVMNPNIAAVPGGALWAARSPYILGFEATPNDEPLLYRFDPLAGEGVGIAAIEPVDRPMWNRLANSGPVAAGADGTGFFAFLLRNEIRAYTPDGDLKWRVRRSLPFETLDDAFVFGREEADFRTRPVTQALTVGPDGLLYAMTASDSLPLGVGTIQNTQAGVRRIEVYDPESGILVRAATVPAAWSTLAADGKGRVFRVDPEAIDATAPPAERAPLPEVTFETWDGEATTFAAFRGKALLVNFWASWCLPCQEELPELKAYYETLDKSRVEFVAIGEDEDAEAGREFAQPLELPFPLFLGHGRMQEAFHYVALPYTLVVDYRGRIVKEFYGFGSDESWAELRSSLEAEMDRLTPVTETGTGVGAAEPHQHDAGGPPARGAGGAGEHEGAHDAH